jgi:hypothetical protein
MLGVTVSVLVCVGEEVTDAVGVTEIEDVLVQLGVKVGVAVGVGQGAC